MKPDLITAATLDDLTPLLRDYVIDCHDSMVDDYEGWFDSDAAPDERICLYIALCDALERGYEHRHGTYPFGHTATQWKRLYRDAEELAKQMQAEYSDLPAVDSNWQLASDDE